MQSSKEKTEPTSASGLGKWAEDGTGACAGERPDGCLPGARAARGARHGQAVDRRREPQWRQCASPWQAARRRPRVTRPAAGMRPVAEATRLPSSPPGRWTWTAACAMPTSRRPWRTRRFRPARTCSRRRPRARPAMWTRRRCSGVHEGATADSTKPKKLKKSDVTPATCQAAGLPRRKPGRARGAHSRRDGADRLERDDGQPARGHGPDGRTRGHRVRRLPRHAQCWLYGGGDLRVVPPCRRVRMQHVPLAHDDGNLDGTSFPSGAEGVRGGAPQEDRKGTSWNNREGTFSRAPV